MWAALYGEEQASTVLVGHSAGGAVAVRLAADPQVSLAFQCLPGPAIPLMCSLCTHLLWGQPHNVRVGERHCRHGCSEPGTLLRLTVQRDVGPT